MEYTFSREGVPEKVEMERWCWGVVYNDDTELLQFGADGIFHQVKEIEQERVKMFVMYKPHSATEVDGNDKRIDMPVKDVQIFQFYRILTLAAGTSEERRVKVYVFGWKDAKTGATSYNYILPDDRVLTSNHNLPDLTVYAI
jgi:hypothetical protein